MSEKSTPSLIHAIFLVSGTSIGAGMLAQPVASSLMGFLPSTLMMLFSWAFMAATALVLVEVCLWMPKGAHVISMADHFLGPIGKSVAWVIYLFMAYLSLTAYITGGGDILEKTLTPVIVLGLPQWLWCLIFVLIFGIVIEISNKAVSFLNTILFSTLVISYLAIILIGFGGIRFSNLATANFSNSFVILPLLLASFSFQMIVPSLVSYLEQDRKRLRLAIILGTGVSFAIYSLWNAIVLGHESSLGDAALAEAYAKGLPPTSVLSGSGKSWFSFFINSFSFFALVTSFIGISWGLFDFLADGTRLLKKGKNRLLLWILVIFPPLLIASTYPESFISALESTGAYGDTILNAIIPVLMFFVGHRLMKNPSSSRFIKNRFTLALLLILAISLILYQLFDDLLKFGLWLSFT